MISCIDSGSQSASTQMQKDLELIESLSTQEMPLLRLYSWQRKSITYGYFIDIHKYIDTEKAIRLGYDIARRPTGGGLLFHVGDFSFTFALPAHHTKYIADVVESYHVINRALLHALNLPHTKLQKSDDNAYRHLCMAQATKYDLLYNDKKIGGAAQRRTKAGLIHQSSLFLALPDWREVASFYLGTVHELEAMQKQAACAVAPRDLPTRFLKELEVCFSDQIATNISTSLGASLPYTS